MLDALNEDLAPLLFPSTADGSNPRICPKCGTGTLSLQLGKSGGFIGCSNYPECNYTRQFGAEGARTANPTGPKDLGKDPYTGEEITLRSGRFGPMSSAATARKRSAPACPRAGRRTVSTTRRRWRCCRCRAMSASIPRSGKMISAGLGRYGPFVLHDGTYANVEVHRGRLLHRPQPRRRGPRRQGFQGPRRRSGGTPAALKELGDHPDGGKITVRDGKYGPYVNHEKINATLPKGKDPMAVTHRGGARPDRRARGQGRRGKKPARKAAVKPAAAKKPAAKKTAAKKPAAKKAAAGKKA